MAPPARPATVSRPTPAREVEPADPGPAAARARAALVAVGSVAAATAVAGGLLAGSGVRLHLAGGLVLRASFAPAARPATLAALLAFAVLAVASGPTLGRRLRWRPMLLAVTGACALWAVGLALLRDTPAGNGLTAPLTSPYEYLHDVPRFGSLTQLWSTYVEHVPAGSTDPWTTHVGGHPPGPLAFFALLDRVGLAGPGWAAAACIAAGVAAAPAVLVALRAVHGESAARTVAPYLVLAPWWLWVATSADALWTGTSAWAVAIVALASRHPTRSPAALAWGAGAGALLGISMLGSYGAVLVGLVAAAVVVRARRGDVALACGLGALVPLGGAALAGFWWPAGLAATSARVADGPAALDRPSLYFLAANLVAAAAAVGPAVVAGAAGLGRRLWSRPLLLGALAAVLVADLSGLAKGEVERIWLPFYPWLTTAVVGLAVPSARRWLAAQAGFAIILQILLATEW